METLTHSISSNIILDQPSDSMSQDASNDAFARAIVQLRADYQKARDSTHLFPPAGRIVMDQAVAEIEGVMYHTYWYDDGSLQGQCIRLAYIPGTLSGDILSLRQDLPTLDGDHEIVGDQVRRLEEHPNPPPPDDDDSEDLTAVLASLPVIDVDSDKHFVKKGKYESEVRNLLKCQNSFCPGVPISPFIVQLLGRSAHGELVFERSNPRYILSFVKTLAIYKNWILQLTSGLQSLHSVDIIHRDLRIDNLLFSSGDTKVIICDLESRWGIRRAPEISRQPILDAGWTEKSDIYDLANVIKGMIYGNAPITDYVEWPVPPPLDAIVEACTRDSPHDRPDLAELCTMVNGLNAADSENIR